MSTLLPEPVTPSPVTPARFRTAADWLESLGDVPLARILFDPLPGTATEADLLRKVERDHQRCELVDGTLVEKTMGYREGLIAGIIIRILGNFVSERRLGYIGAPDTMMRILPTKTRLPDVSFVAIERHRQLDSAARVPRVTPDLAVEIPSETNTRAEMTLKLAEYFEAGTRLVWYVDPRTRTVDVYTSIESVTRLTDADTLTGGDVLPGFEVRVGEFFAIE